MSGPVNTGPRSVRGRSAAAPTLSRDLTELGPRYNVVVVGSGYGGSIAAYRFAAAGLQVALLERGREIPTGAFPETLAGASREFQVDTPAQRTGPTQALFDLHVNSDISVLVGCGLGGTSLINAGVAIEPDGRVFDDPGWPAEIRNDREGLQRAFATARRMLGSEPYPDDRPEPAKLRSLRQAADTIGAPWEKVPINVSFRRGANHVGVDEHPCTDCGNCISGCNEGAKRTLPLTYLPAAADAGAEIYCGLRVGWIAPARSGWVVHATPLTGGRQAFDAPSLSVGADLVVLAAGTLGSTEILLRSREAGLPVSGRVGHGFSGNGDTLGFAAFTDELVDGVGHSHRERQRRSERQVGPCITGVVDLRSTEDLDEGMIIEDGAIPGALGSRLAPMLRAATSSFTGTLPLVGDAVRRLQTHLVMAHDDAGGTMVLEQGRLRVRWPAVGDQPTFGRIDDTVRALASAQDGTYVPNPVWARLLRNSLVTVHPLGGCSMGDDAGSGVVNHRGEVFTGAGAEVHPGLTVLDGSIVPRSLGVNPLLTISGLAERACSSLLASPPVEWTRSPTPATATATARPGVRFTETMRGHVLIGSATDTVVAAELARGLGSELRLTVTVSIDDLEGRILDGEIVGGLTGTVAGVLGPRAQRVDGHYTLLTADPTSAAGRRVHFEATTVGGEGRRYRLTGHRTLRPGSPLRWWGENSTLHLTVVDADTGEQVGLGILRTGVADLARQMATLRATHPRSRSDHVRQPAALVGTYAKAVVRTYALARRAPSESAVTVGPASGARLPHASRVVTTVDGVEIRLTTHLPGGDVAPRGRVLVVPDLGCTSAVFSTRHFDLIGHLLGRGHEVWTLDWRGTPVLAEPATPSGIGDAVHHDVAAAFDAMGSSVPVHVIGHGLGAGIVLAALHDQPLPVVSVLSLQMGLEIDPTIGERVRLRLRSEDSAIGKGLSTPTPPRWAGDPRRERLPVLSRLGSPARHQRCDRPSCRRLQALYGAILTHDRLDPEAHDLLPRLVAPVPARLVQSAHDLRRRGALVARPAPGAPGLAVPMTFVHTESNGVYRPHGTRRSVDALRAAHPDVSYRWVPMTGFGHLDLLLSPRAARHLLPVVDDHLDRSAAGTT